jgi:ribosome recycling factor
MPALPMRHVRRDGMDTLKRLEKDGDISQDESRDESSDDVQKHDRRDDRRNRSLLVEKEKEIMQV